eukprot:COSAG01_NODE_552_length_15569_cov_37.676123_7_plen_66_part_00
MLSCLLGVVGPTQKLLVCMRVRPPCETWCSPIANGSGGASATGAAPAAAVAAACSAACRNVGRSQ